MTMLRSEMDTGPKPETDGWLGLRVWVIPFSQLFTPLYNIYSLLKLMQEDNNDCKLKNSISPAEMAA